MTPYFLNPKIVIKKRFLYRKRFLKVDFHVKLRDTCRKQIVPAGFSYPLGSAGRISDAGVSRQCPVTEKTVAPTVHTVAAPAAIIANFNS